MTAVDAMQDYFRFQAEACAQLDSPLTAGLCEYMAKDLAAKGPVYDLLHDWPGNPLADVVALRLTGALHGAALSGRDAALANACLLYTSPSPRDQRGSRMPSSA